MMYLPEFPTSIDTVFTHVSTEYSVPAQQLPPGSNVYQFLSMLIDDLILLLLILCPAPIIFLPVYPLF